LRHGSIIAIETDKTVRQIAPVSEMIYTVSSGTLNSSIPYQTDSSVIRYHTKAIVVAIQQVNRDSVDHLLSIIKL